MNQVWRLEIPSYLSKLFPQTQWEVLQVVRCPSPVSLRESFRVRKKPVNGLRWSVDRSTDDSTTCSLGALQKWLVVTVNPYLPLSEERAILAAGVWTVRRFSTKSVVNQINASLIDLGMQSNEDRLHMRRNRSDGSANQGEHVNADCAVGDRRRSIRRLSWRE